MSSYADPEMPPRSRQRRPTGGTGAGAEGRSSAGERDFASPRRGAKRTLMGTIQALPQYLKLFYGLFRDPRVNRLDKWLVGAAIAYVLAPIDFIPDVIPFLGQVDDVFLLVTALQRLLMNAGRRVVLSHWTGEPSELNAAHLEAVVGAAAFFLPGKMRKRLRMIGRFR